MVFRQSVKQRLGRIATVVLVLTMVTLFGCTALVPLTPASDPATATPAPTEVEETPMPADASNADPAANSAVEQAKADLAERLSIDRETIEVVEAQDVEWRDSSLGCPQPGMMYAQVVTPGMRIVLSADGAEYHYHAGRNSEPFLCENPPESAGQSAPAAPTSPGAIASPDAQAIADLAAQLNISPQEITLVRMQEVDWPSGALGCPQPDMRYTQVVVNGTFIQLQVGDQLYNYHSGGGRPPFLCTSPNEVVPGE